MAKLGVVEEEVDETALWLELIVEGGLKEAAIVGPLHDEADQLTRIVVKSIVTARSSIHNPKSQIRNP